jgi:hypothetical protein
MMLMREPRDLEAEDEEWAEAEEDEMVAEMGAEKAAKEE